MINLTNNLLFSSKIRKTNQWETKQKIKKRKRNSHNYKQIYSKKMTPSSKKLSQVYFYLSFTYITRAVDFLRS